MFGSSSPKDTTVDDTAVPSATEASSTDASAATDNLSQIKSDSSLLKAQPTTLDGSSDKKRRSSGVSSRASSLLASAKNSLHFSPNPNTREGREGYYGGRPDDRVQTPLQKLGKQDAALSVPQGTHNNSAGDSQRGPRSTFSVGVWEDKNKKCRRTMEDTHAFLYNFLQTPAPDVQDLALSSTQSIQSQDSTGRQSRDGRRASTVTAPVPVYSSQDVQETDNGYFAIFDGHAGTFAADWCGKKLHIILEETIRKNPNTPIPELLDQTFTNVDQQLDKLPLKNSGCTAIVAMLRWEDRVPHPNSATGSQSVAPATVSAVKGTQQEDTASTDNVSVSADSAIASIGADAAPEAAQPPKTPQEAQESVKAQAKRSRVLYTANVGDARIVLCRNGKALRLSYDHKGSDENEGRRIQAAGGLILNNRVNGVLAVTRALGDAYMKDLVTGHPYTTETVIQADQDEFIILACDGLWDVCSDQEAVDLVRNIQEPVQAAKVLVEHALARFSTDNLSCMMVRLDKSALHDTTENPASAIGVEGDRNSSGVNKVSEVEKILGTAQKVIQDGHEPVGVSGSNSGKGHDPIMKPEGVEQMEPVTEEEANLAEDGDVQIDPTKRAELKGAPLLNEGGSAFLIAPDWSPSGRARADSGRSGEAP